MRLSKIVSDNIDAVYFQNYDGKEKNVPPIDQRIKLFFAEECSHKGGLPLTHNDLRAPIRVINVADTIAQKRLVHVQAIAKNYCALSHRWNSDINRCMYTGNEETILPDKISKELQYLQDAMNTFGDVNCWVDAWCINQENEQEQNDQISIMASIYKSATRIYILPNGLTGKWKLVNLDTQGITLCEWFTRSWTLQEYLMAKEAYFIEKNLSDQLILQDISNLYRIEDKDINYIRNNCRKITKNITIHSSSSALLKILEWCGHAEKICSANNIDPKKCHIASSQAVITVRLRHQANPLSLRQLLFEVSKRRVTFTVDYLNCIVSMIDIDWKPVSTKINYIDALASFCLKLPLDEKLNLCAMSTGLKDEYNSGLSWMVDVRIPQLIGSGFVENGDFEFIDNIYDVEKSNAIEIIPKQSKQAIFLKGKNNVVVCTLLGKTYDSVISICSLIYKLLDIDEYADEVPLFASNGPVVGGCSRGSYRRIQQYLNDRDTMELRLIAMSKSQMLYKNANTIMIDCIIVSNNLDMWYKMGLVRITLQKYESLQDAEEKSYIIG